MIPDLTPQKKVTKKDYAEFKRAFLRYVEVFGLRDWNVYFYQIPDLPHFADVMLNTEGRVCDVSLCGEYPASMQRDNLWDETALHEIIHVVLADFSRAAGKRDSTEEQLRDLEEALTVRLTNAFLKKGA
jgi:hypothetical protein